MDVRDRVADAFFTVGTIARTGLVRPTRPDRLARMAAAYSRYGASPAVGYALGAIRQPDELAIVDERGTLTFAEVHRRTDALASAFAARGIRPGDAVAILCRNHRGFIETTVACAKLGAHCLYLNTMFAAPQIADVVERERPVALVFDEEFTEMVGGAGAGLPRFIAWSDGPGSPQGADLLEDLIAAAPAGAPPPPGEKSRFVILTSGTTGTPKGATRRSPDSIAPFAALLSKIPLRSRSRLMIAAPLFHSWGFLHLNLALGLGCGVVLRRRFEPEQVLADVARHRCRTLAVVPVMLQRILDLGEETIRRYDLSALETIDVSGSALPGELATRVMDVFGDVLYNLYGSTEVAWATIATPEDMRAAPGTAGRPPHGTVVKLFDDAGREVPQGATGRIFVGSQLQFEGYTGGGTKDVVQGLMSSGDVGHFDVGGRLFVDGRDDEMIVSGGENVFPREVEDLLADHPAVDEAAVIGVPDADWGQRLAAFVVTKPGAQLDDAAVKRHVKDNLAGFKVPRDVRFLDALPRNATGKVLKRELAVDV
jgi:fatty-acyl-CoA synthase